MTHERLWQAPVPRRVSLTTWRILDPIVEVKSESLPQIRRLPQCSGTTGTAGQSDRDDGDILEGGLPVASAEITRSLTACRDCYVSPPAYGAPSTVSAPGNDFDTIRTPRDQFLGMDSPNLRRASRERSCSKGGCGKDDTRRWLRKQSQRGDRRRSRVSRGGAQKYAHL